MPLSFLAPVFLVGLAALAIPVLIHLAHRPRRQVVEFPSLMFVPRVEYRDTSRRRIRNVVLFLLRSLALVLLAAAFARPFVDRPAAAPGPPDGGREVVVLLDRSASMGVGDRMERGKAAIADLARGLQRGDRATLVSFDDEAAAVHRATDQPAVLLGAVRDVEVGEGATRLVPALRLAESLLAGSPLPRRELLLVSDFQRSGWDPAEAPVLPPGTDIRTVDVGAPVENVFVVDARFRTERFSGRDRVRVNALVASRGGGGDVPVELALDGWPVATRTVAVPAGGAATVEFDPVTLPDRTARGVVRTPADAVPGDDAFHFVLSSTRALRVLVAGPAGGPFLERALAVEPRYAVADARAARLEDAPLADLDVVVVAGEPSPVGVERLAGWVEAGGGLVVVLGPGSRGRSWAGSDLLPGSLGGTRDAGAAGVPLTTLRLDHPAFEPFRGADPGLAAARFYRYRELDPAADAAVLARFPDGSPAIVERPRGLGRVVALASPLDGEWSDLVLQPAFVPLIHRLVRYAAGSEPAPAWRTVGELLEAGTGVAIGDEDGGEPGSEPGAAAVLLTPSDRAIAVRPDSLYRLSERGFYQLRDPRDPDGGITVAVNGDPSESEPERVDPEEVSAAIGSSPSPTMTASFTAEDRERRQGFWWYALAAVFVLLAVETALSNKLSRRGSPRIEEGEARP